MSLPTDDLTESSPSDGISASLQPERDLNHTDKPTDESTQQSRAVPGPDPPAAARQAEDLPGVCRRGGQDLRDAAGRKSPAEARRRRGDRLRGNPRPGRDHRPDRRTRTGAPPQDRVSRHHARGDGPRRRAGPPADDRPGRRIGPHQRPRQPQSETLPRRRRTAARGHQRHHHAQHPAPGKPARHRRAGHRRSRQGAVARLRRHDGRPDRQRRPFGGRPPRAACRPERSIPASGSRRPWTTSSRRRS